MTERELLLRTAELAGEFLDTLDTRPVFPPDSMEDLGASLGGPLPDRPADPLEVIEQLASAADRGVVATASGRYFGYVIGGALPAALAADWLASRLGPVRGLRGAGAVGIGGRAGRGRLAQGAARAARAGFVCPDHRLPDGARDGPGRRAARGARARRLGPGRAGPGGVAADHRDRRCRRATRPWTARCACSGSGRRRSQPVAADDQGRMRPAALREALGLVDGPAIVCAQAGEVNTGAFDPLGEIADAVARRRGHGCTSTARSGCGRPPAPSAGTWWTAWRGRTRARPTATSGSTSPTTAGSPFCSDPGAHRAAMTAGAAYFAGAGDWQRDAFDWTPESSRRARGFPVYAALRSLGREGVAELVDRCCARARQAAAGPRSAARLLGAERRGSQPGAVSLRGRRHHRRRPAAGYRQSGEAWLGGTTWEGASRDQAVGVELAHERARHRPDAGGVRAAVG